MHAAEGGDLARAQKLLAAGADVNEADDGGWTPLFNAAHHGHAALIRLLLSHGARIDYLNHNGETALMVAAGAGQLATSSSLFSTAPGCTKYGIVDKQNVDRGALSEMHDPESGHRCWSQGATQSLDHRVWYQTHTRCLHRSDI